MKRTIKVVLLVLTSILIYGCSFDSENYYEYEVTKEISDEQFEYQGNYLPPELVIDGKDLDSEWENNSSDTLVFGCNNAGSVKFFRGERALFAFFDVKDTNLLTHGNNNGDDVTRSDSIELYIDFKNNGGSKPDVDDLQINIGIHGKTRILIASGGMWGSWNGLIDYAINLDGTLNNKSDNDSGYQVELMIPYSQTGMEKDDVIGIALGHVNKAGDLPTDYSWEGLVFDGEFVDPQVPNKYVVYSGNQFYSRGHSPLSDINVSGVIKNQIGEPVLGAEVKISNQQKSSLSSLSGDFNIYSVDRNSEITIEITKEGFISYKKKYSFLELKKIIDEINLEITLLDKSKSLDTTFIGTIKNVQNGDISLAKVVIGDSQSLSNDKGEFTLPVVISENLSINVEKEGYVLNNKSLDIKDVVIDGITDLGEIDLGLASDFTFTAGGQRGISSVTSTITRGLNGFYIESFVDSRFPQYEKYELFIDTKETTLERDSSDYRIDFHGSGDVTIINFNDGTNTLVTSSGITYSIERKALLSALSIYIPYSFLQVDPLEIIGLTAGVWNEEINKETGLGWDGLAFEDTFRDPAKPNDYFRVGVSNDLYTNSDNYPVTLPDDPMRKGKQGGKRND